MTTTDGVGKSVATAHAKWGNAISVLGDCLLVHALKLPPVFQTAISRRIVTHPMCSGEIIQIKYVSISN